MTKQFITLVTLILALPMSSFANSKSAQNKESNINMTCVTEFPTTSFFVRQHDKKVSVRVIHHNGVKYAPIWSGLITPNDIGRITEAADSVSKLGDDFEITWNRDGCNADTELFFQCVGQAQDFTTATGQKVHPWALSVYDVTENSIFGEFKKKTLNLRFDVDGQSNQINMDYQTNECFVDQSSLERAVSTILGKAHRRDR